MSGKTTPITLERLEIRLRASRLVRYPSFWQSSRMRSRVSGLISGALLMALETVVTETPAIRAMSLIVTRRMKNSASHSDCYICW